MRLKRSLQNRSDCALNTRKQIKCHPFITAAENRRTDILTDKESTPEATFDPVAEAKRLLRCSRAATLATLAEPEGFPFASLVNVATAPDGSPILLLSRLAGHTRHLDADPRMSLLLYSAINQPSRGDPLAHSRLTILGKAKRATDAIETMLRTRFLARHPKSNIYADFVDFGFFYVTIESAHLNGGFGRAANISAAKLLTPIEDADDLTTEEPDLIAEITDKEPNFAQDLAQANGGASEKAWRAVGFDPEGLDIGNEERLIRIPFTDRVTTEKELRTQIAALLAKARKPG